MAFVKSKLNKYNNTTYWKDIHKKNLGPLQTVGHPMLCKNLNRLKYESESSSILSSLQDIGYKFTLMGKKKLSILDVGAGGGFWLKIVNEAFEKQGFRIELTALDLSREALETLQRHNSHINIIQEDLKTINPDIFSNSFDLVISCYCLHHLVNLEDFLNALRFAGRSVNRGGFLIVMDPVLNLPFSKFDIIDFPTYAGNGIPRHLYLLEDILGKEGFFRQVIQPAVSFLLNGNIEGYGWFSYSMASIIWKVLCMFVYKSDPFVKLSTSILLVLDKALKSSNLSFSSSVCVYRKSNSEI